MMLMKWCIFATIILIQLNSFQCNTIEYSAYGKATKITDDTANGNLTNNSDKQNEKHRAREGVINSDRWIPKT